MPLQKWSDQIWLCQMSPAPTFSEEIDTLLGQFGKAEPKPHVVLDLSGVEVLNSSNLSQMLRVRKVVTEEGSKMRVAGPTDAVWSLLLTTGLDKVFDFAQDTMMALAELQISE